MPSDIDPSKEPAALEESNASVNENAVPNPSDPQGRVGWTPAEEVVQRDQPRHQPVNPANE